MNTTSVADRVPINTWKAGRREPYDAAELRKEHPDLLEEEFWKICEDVWPYTCLMLLEMYSFYTAINYAVEKDVPGDVVECGVFFGGSIMLAAHTLERRGALGARRLFGFDTFTGFVRRTENDIDYLGNEVCQPCVNEHNHYAQAEANIRSVPCNQSAVEIVCGDVFEVLGPTIKDRSISVLRLDTDTYDTTRHELEVSWENISPGGVVIIDDYGWCRGARKATDEFFCDKKVYLNRISPWARSIVKL